MKDGAEHHMNCAEGAWGRFRRTGASVTNSAGCRVCLAAGTSVRMLSVARFFYCHLFFVSIFGGCVPPDAATPVVKCCVVLCATFLHRVPMVTAHRVRLGTDSLAGEPECWWFSYWLVREKSLSHFFCFVHRTESFLTLSVQTLGLHTDGAGAVGSVIN